MVVFFFGALRREANFVVVAQLPEIVKQSTDSSSFSCISVVFVTVKGASRQEGNQNSFGCSKASCLNFCVLMLEQTRPRSKASSVLNSPSLTRKKTVITSLSATQPRLFPRGGGEKAFIHSLAVAVGPREHPFQTRGERDHPSAGLLRIFMTG